MKGGAEDAFNDDCSPGIRVGARDGDVAEVVAVILGASEGENVTLGGWVTLAVEGIDDIGGADEF